MMKRFFLFATFFCVVLYSSGQDTLPRFTVKNLGNDREGIPSVVISWVNGFDSLKQISIQTSYDSLKNYRTLISLTDPNAKQNGFADKKAPNDHMFYRLFIVRGDGQYFFTQAKRPYLDTARTITPIETVVAKKPETVIVKKPEFTPSFYVYTNKEGYVYINLPDADKKKYRIRFYEDDNSFLFEVKNIRQTGITLDKTNFLHAGWFNFELFNDDDLVEKHRFYLGKDF